MRILIAGGGTGGHLFPALAIAEELRRQERDIQILFLGGDRGLESQQVPREGYEFVPVPIRGWSRRLNRQSVLFGWFLIRGLARSLVVLRRYRPDAVVGTGGYVSGPVVFLASLFGIPTLIQEQNSYPGVTTRLLSYRVDQVHLSFTESGRYFRRTSHLRFSGNPLRSGFGQTDRRSACRAFSLDPARKIVLVMGGSQGAHSINMAIARGLDQLMKNRIQVIWQTGSRDLASLREQFAESGRGIVMVDFIQDVKAAYGAADVVVCRAGATTVAEIAVCGLPAIFVPYPYAAADHQRMNALALVEAGAAEMVLNGELESGRLIVTLMSLLQDEQRRSRIAERIRSFGRPEAATTVARAIRQMAKER